MQYRVVKKHPGELESTEGNPIGYDLYAPLSDSGSIPVIIFLHGFKGFKDWGTFPDAFFEIARLGFAVVAVNLSHNGLGPHSDEFDRPDLFRTQTLSQDINDVRTVVEALISGKIGSSAGLNSMFPIGIVGHSRGAHTAIVAAAEIDDISCVVTWSSVADCVDFWDKKMVTDWTTKGVVQVKNSRTGQILEVDRTLYDDAVNNRETLSALHRIGELYIPCLFIHGTEDETVPHVHSQKLHEACRSLDKEKYLIEGASHTYGSAHPFEGEDLPPHFTEVIDQTVSWFQMYLK